MPATQYVSGTNKIEMRTPMNPGQPNLVTKIMVAPIIITGKAKAFMAPIIRH